MTIHRCPRERRRTTLRLVAALSLLSPILAPTLASAQSEAAQCSAGARHVSEGRSELAIGKLEKCATAGPDAVSRGWARTTNHDEKDVEALAALSKVLRDGRVYGAAFAVAEDASRPTSQRLAALEVLVSHYKPGLWASRDYLTTSAIGDPIPHVMHQVTRTGSTPLPQSRAADLPTLFAKLSKGDPDPTIRGAAQRLRAAFAHREPSHTPLEPGSVRLEGCGAIVVLKWTTDITISLRVRVLGTDVDNTYTPNATSRQNPKQVSLSLPDGIVVAYFGNREVARLEDRTSGCGSLGAKDG